MRLTRALGFAGALIISAVVGGTLIGSVFAQDESSDATRTDAPYCDAFMDALASELDVSRDALVAAGMTAANAAIDAAVEAGDLSADRADALRERIDEADGNGCAWFGHGFRAGFGRGFAHGVGRGFIGGDALHAAADALGVDSSDLIGELRDAGSLRAVAEDHGVAYDDVTDAVLAAVQADLDAAVDEGLSPQRADAAIERLTEWLDNGGEVGRFGGGPFGGHHGPGFGGRSDDSGDDAGA